MILTNKQKREAFKKLVIIGKSIGVDDPKAMVEGFDAFLELACQIGGLPMLLATGKACFGFDPDEILGGDTDA